MSFSDYKTLAQVQTEFQISYEECDFIPKEIKKLPSYFIEELEFNINKLDAFSSEAARCELIILPILREVYKSSSDNLALWVQKSVRYNDSLNGTPDYMVSKRSALGKTVLEFPLLMVAEAKKNDFEQGWAQCLAELVAAQKLNNDTNKPVLGVVTDGKYWEFGKLVEQVFYKNKSSFLLDNLAQLFASLAHVFNLAENNIL